MKMKIILLMLLVVGLSCFGTKTYAIDVGWMQKGVRVWYLGGVGSASSSNAEEAYLFEDITGDSARVIHHSALNHWGSPQAPETEMYSLAGKGPCWIHPLALQNLEMGDYWMGFEITLVTRSLYTYDMLPYAFLPAKALFDLKPQREIVKIVYMIANYSTGTAYFDAETGLLLQYSTSDGFVTVFFILSEINYDFAAQTAFAEDEGPHTGFKSFVSEQSMNYYSLIGGGSLIIQSLVETRYGNTVEMRVLTANTKDSIKQLDENYCFFGDVPVLKYIDATEALHYPPENWDDSGEYLWWWLPRKALLKATINILDVPMIRTATAPFTFTATEQPAGFFFSEIVFGNDGYMVEFSAKDSETGLDIDPGDDYFQNLTTVNGLDYYRNTMGLALPDQCPDDPDKAEPGICGCGIADIDSDEDGIADCIDPDDDNDGLTDNEEDINQNGIIDTGETDPFNPDSDYDGLTDGLEVEILGTNPLLPDSDGNGIQDGNEDSDGDGYTNAEEVLCGSEPGNPDSKCASAQPWLMLLLED
jgi:Bacterial TSP3 repeat